MVPAGPPDPGVVADLGPRAPIGTVAPMSASSDRAELSTLRSALDDLTDRLVKVADGYRNTEDSAVTGDLDQAERGLIAARRAVDRAIARLAAFG
jgi:hypothetical protein